MIEKAEELFKKADVNGDGQLSLEEFYVLIEQAKKEYPQVCLFFNKALKSLDKLVNCMCSRHEAQYICKELSKVQVLQNNVSTSTCSTSGNVLKYKYMFY